MFERSTESRAKLAGNSANAELPAFCYIERTMRPKADLSKHLSKPGESISFKGDRVIKYFADEKIVKDRVERAKILGDLVPKIIETTSTTYAYKFVEGELLSKITDTQKFKDFLEFCEKKLWKKKKLTPKEKKEFREKTRRFYFDKTMKRLEKFYKDTGIKDRPGLINGERRPTLKSLLKKVDWEELSRGESTLFHGDLQPENILVMKKDFKLIDWRHDFEGLKEYGDAYYDFAKLYHALIITHQVIRDKQYAVKRDGADAEFHFLIKSNLAAFKDIFDKFLIKKGYDLGKVQTLTALIYLNIAPLHHSPYNELLYYLGKDMLYKRLNS